MKKLFSIFLAVCMMLSLFTFQAFAADKISLSAQKLTVNGQSVDCEKYNINGSNYFKLRDVAQLLNGTASQFEVGYDNEAKVVSITTNAAYTSVGGELTQRKDYSKTAVPSTQKIMINGNLVSNLSVYNIGGNNFFKLRDLGTALNFNVDFNQQTNTAIIESVDYTSGEQKPEETSKTVKSDKYLEAKFVSEDATNVTYSIKATSELKLDANDICKLCFGEEGNCMTESLTASKLTAGITKTYQKSDVSKYKLPEYFFLVIGKNTPVKSDENIFAVVFTEDSKTVTYYVQAVSSFKTTQQTIKIYFGESDNAMYVNCAADEFAGGTFITFNKSDISKHNIPEYFFL